MTSKKVTIKGLGPEMFGRGIDLLFGDADEAAQRQDANGQPAKFGPDAERLNNVDPLAAAASSAREEAYLDGSSGGQPLPAPTSDENLLLAAEAFFSGQAALPVIDGTPSHTVLFNETPATEEHNSETVAVISAAAAIAQQDHEGIIMPTPIPDQPIAAAGAPQEAQPPEDTQSRKAGVPSSNGKGGADEAALSAEIAAKEATALTRQETKEILGKLRRSDLNALDREVDVLYDKVATLLSANRQEATVAFDILRRVRLILLKDPEQYADAEYLVNQVRARMNQIEQSLEGGRANAPRIFAYQTIWMVVFALLAMVTTVNGTTFSAWVAYLLGVEVNNEQLTWVVLFMSTLAWGGIGGVTSALWSLYHHISIDRDYNPVENLWYYSQPVLGMVLGGFVFLVFSAGFLVVQIDLNAENAAMGARLLPAAIAVVAGFRQNMVLDLVERIVSLIVPSQQSADSALQASVQQPIQQPPEELVI